MLKVTQETQSCVNTFTANNKVLNYLPYAQFCDA